MNDLVRLRQSVLLALGLPALGLAAFACGATSPTPGTGNPTDGRDRLPVARRRDPVGATATVSDACKDPGYACATNERGCGPDATEVRDDFYTGKLRGKDWTPSDPATLAAMRFDEKRTADTRAELSPGQDPDMFCCYAGCAVYTEGPLERAEPTVATDLVHCVPHPETTAFPAKDEPRCPAALDVVGTMRPFSSFSTEDGLCCYETGRRRGPLGRPLRDGDRATTVSSRRGAGSQMLADGIDLGRYDTAARAREAAAWHAAALLEHASVASFGKVSLELLAFGAPAELVRDAHAAAIDELDHAALCSAIAAAFGADDVPGRHEAAARVVPHVELAAFVRETLVDGCVGESIAALEAARASAAARDPVIASAYRTIADDEARHAALAFRIVAWACTIDSAIEGLVRRTLADLEENADFADTVRTLVRPCLEAHFGRGAVAPTTLA